MYKKKMYEGYNEINTEKDDGKHKRNEDEDEVDGGRAEGGRRKGRVKKERFFVGNSTGLIFKV